MGVWYFVPLYITSVLVILLIFDNLNYSCKLTKLFRVIVISTAIFGAITPIIYLKFYIPRSLKPYTDVKRELNVLGNCGLIGEFWNSYVSSCSNPEIIISTPHDKSDVRNYDLVKKVFEQENLYLIKDMWLDSFPDTISQFGNLLLKDGLSFKLGDCELNKYIKIKGYNKFDESNLFFNRDLLVKDIELNKNIFFIPNECDSCKQQFVIKSYPLSLKTGNYRIIYNVKLNNFTNKTETIYYEITYDWGNKKVFEKFTYPNEYKASDFTDYSIEFNLVADIKNVEIKIYYHGNCDFYFNNFILIQY